MKNRTFSFCLFVTILSSVCALHTRGVVPLDSFTFDKVTNKFPFVFARFDVVYPTGDHQDEFKKFALSVNTTKELLVAEIGVADYGEKENLDLAERFGVKPEDFPEYVIFKQSDFEYPVRYSGHYRADELRKWTTKETGLWLGLSHTLQAYDRMAFDFMQSSEEFERNLILKQAETDQEGLSEMDQKSASFYIKYMKKIMEKGGDFIDNEISRVEKLRDEAKTSLKKKVQLNVQSNILNSFKREPFKEEEVKEKIEL